MQKGIDYIVIPELPQEQQQPFSTWLLGKPMPIVETEGDNKFNCAYMWDYKKWLSAWQIGKTAKVID